MDTKKEKEKEKESNVRRVRFFARFLFFLSVYITPINDDGVVGVVQIGSGQCVRARMLGIERVACMFVRDALSSSYTRTLCSSV